MTEMTDLERFTRSVTDPSFAQPIEYEPTDEDLDLEEAEPADAEPAGWDDFLASLDAEETERATTDAAFLEYRWGMWELRQDAADTFAKAHHPDGSGPVATLPAEATLADGRPVVSGNDVVRWVNESAAQGLLPDGMSAETYIARLAGANRAAYRAFAFEAGLPPDSKPSYNSLSRGSQTEVMQAEVDSWTADTFRKRLG